MSSGGDAIFRHRLQAYESRVWFKSHHSTLIVRTPHVFVFEVYFVRDDISRHERRSGWMLLYIFLGHFARKDSGFPCRGAFIKHRRFSLLSKRL